MPQAEWYHSLWQQIDALDKLLFLQLNRGWTNPLFDVVLPYLRTPVFWAPLYTLLISFMLLNYGRRGLWWSLAFIITISLTDLIGARIFKEGFERECR